MKRYLRPLGLLWGADARRAIAMGRAGRLGGHASIAFASIEIITRTGTIDRRIVPYGELEGDPILAAIEAQRAPFAGVKFDRPAIMGIVNVTPDSFSDGGLHAAGDVAIAHGMRLAAEGAAILDIGGESTRPGSDGVSETEELARVIPVIEALTGAGPCVSVDTRKAAVMVAAARAGARIINDVSALGHDPGSLETAAQLGLPVVLMHAKGDPKTMQQKPVYDDVALDVFDWLEERLATCVAAGMPRDCLAVDPGIGFGKTFRHNLEILSQLPLFFGLGVPVVIGLSRKAFIGALTGERVAGNRVHGSVGGAIQAALHGAHILRVHDVGATNQALAVALAAVDPELSGLGASS